MLSNNNLTLNTKTLFCVYAMNRLCILGVAVKVFLPFLEASNKGTVGGLQPKFLTESEGHSTCLLVL